MAPFLSVPLGQPRCGGVRVGLSPEGLRKEFLNQMQLNHMI